MCRVLQISTLLIVIVIVVVKGRGGDDGDVEKTLSLSPSSSSSQQKQNIDGAVVKADENVNISEINDNNNKNTKNEEEGNEDKGKEGGGGDEGVEGEKNEEKGDEAEYEKDEGEKNKGKEENKEDEEGKIEDNGDEGERKKDEGDKEKRVKGGRKEKNEGKEENEGGGEEKHEDKGDEEYEGKEEGEGVNEGKEEGVNEGIEGKRILILHPMYAGSHILTLRALSKAMVARGHKVTVVRWKDTHHYPTNLNPNITELVLALNNSLGAVPHMTVEERASFIMPLELMWGRGTDWKALPVDAFLTISTVCDALLSDRRLLQHLRREQFHVAVVDLIYNECSLALAHDLGIPSVGYWAFTFAGGEPQYTTAFSPPSSVPLIMTHYTDVMTFTQRVINHLHAVASHVVMQVQFLVTGYQIHRNLPSCPWPNTLLSNLSGLLINSHPAIDYPRLLPPSFVNVGGLQIHTPMPLPPDILDWLTGSGKAGTIIFSMGFIFQPEVVPRQVISNLLQAFCRLPQRILMKYSTSHNDPPPPHNVKMVNWLPQQDVLSHPQTILFFTHCGMHGVMESLYHGVPMVGMPVFADQRDVLVRLEQRGIARGVDKMDTSEHIYTAIIDVLSNISYRENAQRLSRILRHHPQKPLDQALWLVEHVADTQGASHLKFAARHLNFFQFFGLDVLGFALVVVLLLRRLLRVIRSSAVYVLEALVPRTKLKQS